MLCHQRLTSTIAVLPDHVVLYILNFLAPFSWEGMQNIVKAADGSNRLVVVSPRRAPLQRLIAHVSSGCKKARAFLSRKVFGVSTSATKKQH